MKLWLLILAAGAITFAIRLSFILLFERLKMPEWFRRALRYVPAAVLSAILVPELANWNGSFNLSLYNPQLLSGLLAALVAWRTRNVVLTLSAGLAAFLILNTLIVSANTLSLVK
jgi:branched-subunit amino acid transport protein